MSMAKATGKIPTAILKAPYTNRSARDGPKHTRKIAQDLLENTDKVFLQRIDCSIIQFCKQKKDEPTSV